MDKSPVTVTRKEGSLEVSLGFGGGVRDVWKRSRLQRQINYFWHIEICGQQGTEF